VGSINSVFPVEDLSITDPGTRNLYSFFTGIQTCPFRIVLKESDIHSLLERINASAFSLIRSDVRSISSLTDFKNLEA